MIDFDDSEIKQLVVQLDRLNKRGFFFAAKYALADMMWEARPIAQQVVAEKFTLKNKYTQQSIRALRPTGSTIETLAARVGSTAAYMEKQERGFRSTPFHGVGGAPVPTSAAANQKGAVPRTKPPGRRHRLSQTANAPMVQKGKRAGRKGSPGALISEAAQSNKKHVLLHLGNTSGIFRIFGGKRRPKIEMVTALLQGTVMVPARPWIGEVANRAFPLLRRHYQANLRRQIGMAAVRIRGASY